MRSVDGVENGVTTALLATETPPQKRVEKYHNADDQVETVSNGVATCMAINFIMGNVSPPFLPMLLYLSLTYTMLCMSQVLAPF